MSGNWSDDVLDFWFKELRPIDWFAKSDELDAQITTRFQTTHKQLADNTSDCFLGSPKEAFAAIILFDQFSRNLFRGHRRSFASDPLALAIARGMLGKGWDQEILREQRIFVYLPFEHSEDMADQDTSVALIEALGNEQFTRYAYAHRDVIIRFGRFPHRNAILGRKSTDEEEAYLAQPGSGF
ncbi:MAG: DUF924 family protein [Pseudomonadota bacterium]